LMLGSAAGAQQAAPLRGKLLRAHNV